MALVRCKIKYELSSVHSITNRNKGSLKTKWYPRSEFVESLYLSIEFGRHKLILSKGFFKGD
jgi:hypothetical protein